MIQVLIAEDDCDVAEGLKRNIDGVDSIRVVGIVKNGREACKFCISHDVDIVLMDFKMPELNGLENSNIIKKNNPKIKIIMLTSFSVEETILDAVKANCSGYILKGHKAERIISIIQNVYEGFTIYDPDVHVAIEAQISKYTPDQKQLEQLTDIELSIVKMVTEGKTGKEVAAQLFLDYGYVRNKQSEILQKLGIRNSKELAVWGVKNGLYKCGC